mmetsp:Transcript_29149/g.56201  ORF Transcript_29149/g.56201 Transcript_29149/m.56201 type:complete len:238 (+) Transcript_29149:2920-3633(+)
MDLVVIFAKAHQHRRGAQDVLKVARDGDGAAAPHIGRRDPPLSAERCARGFERGVACFCHRGLACAVALKLHRAIGGQGVLHHLPKALADLPWVLITHQPEGNFGRGLGRQHRLEPVADVPAPDAVHLAGRARPDHLDRGAVLFASRFGQAHIAQKPAMIKGKPLPLAANGIGQFGHTVIETGDRDPAFVIMQCGQHFAEHADRVHRDTAIHAGMQVFVRGGDRQFFAKQAAQHGHD